MVLIETGSEILINASLAPDLAQPIVEVVNSLFVLLGGFIGIWIIIFVVRMRQSYKLHQKLDKIDRDLRLIKKALKIERKKKN